MALIMNSCQVASAAPPRALIVSEVCFLGESLADALTGAGMTVCGQVGSLVAALAHAHMRPEIVLLDVAFPNAVGAARDLAAALPEASLIAFAMPENEESVLAWAESGIAGYVPNTTSVDDLITRISQIRRGEQLCPPRIAGSLLRRIGTGKDIAKPMFSSRTPLTPRELEISGLIASGLSNKEIARSLGISIATTKSHVHSLLGKMSVQRRTDVTRAVSAVR
jgi:two-component system nitrate/nitrite response regulator NarL